MLNFPLPYPDELVYSVVARAGVHMGITSPKQLLDEVFGNRMVIATVDLPNHLKRLSSLYSPGLGYNVKRLVYEHTLFPIYAQFNIADRHNRCLQKMATNSNGAIHLMLGVAASRLKQAKYLHYCPLCLKKQLTDHGEYYWKRQWQIVGADCCVEHGQLLKASINRHDYHRHQFFPASNYNCPIAPQQSAVPEAIKVVRQVDYLLRYKGPRIASFPQWTRFYHVLAGRERCLAGKNVRHDLIRERVSAHWSAEWLSKYGLAIQDKETTWLQAIFRKHRKAFSYLEHIVALDSLLPENWQMDDVLAEVNSVKFCTKITLTDLTVFDNHLNEKTANKRMQWLAELRQVNIKQARLNNAALYAWLYRHDNVWLLLENQRHHLIPVRQKPRIDWKSRDLSLCRKLIKIYKMNKTLPDLPRLSKNWYLSQFNNRSSIEKNLSKMPLTTAFFGRYCEDITDYQIRRLAQKIGCLETDQISRWRLLRLTGLSEERLTSEARSWLADLQEQH